MAKTSQNGLANMVTICNLGNWTLSLKSAICWNTVVTAVELSKD